MNKERHARRGFSLFGLLRRREGISPEQLEAIAEKIKLCEGTERANCMGTSMYLTGAAHKDRALDHLDTYRYLGKLRKTDAPVAGALVVWHKPPKSPIYMLENGLVNHTAIITSINPIILAHRPACAAPFIPSDDFLKVNLEQKWHEKLWKEAFGPDPVAFYVPKHSIYPPIPIRSSFEPGNVVSDLLY